MTVMGELALGLTVLHLYLIDSRLWYLNGLADAWRRAQEILADSRVKSAIQRNQGGRVRDEQEAREASSVTTVPDGRAEVSPESQVRAHFPTFTCTLAWTPGLRFLG